MQMFSKREHTWAWTELHSATHLDRPHTDEGRSETPTAGLKSWAAQLDFTKRAASPPDPALLRKLTLELYLKPRHAPDVSDLGLPLRRLARRWIVSGALGRNTRKNTEKALDAAERLDVSSLAARAPR